MDLFKTGNIITTNDMNALEILAVNESDIAVQDLLNLDFSVLSKTEHKYRLFDSKTVLKRVLESIIEDTDVTVKDRKYILEQMNSRIDKFIINKQNVD